jgi:phosphoglycolate phosphatase-like HAD superfamily hydrolase
MKKLLSLMMALLMIFGTVSFAENAEGVSPAEAPATAPAEESAGNGDGTPFSQWNGGAPSLKALTEYVEAVTDETSPDYIPPVDRIATFDMDGTLMAELAPTYLEVMLLTERILADASWQPDEEMLEFGRMTRDHAPDKSFPADYDYEFSYHQAKAFAGMTLTEYADFITRFLVREADGFDGMTYANAYYLPMAEVVEYLQDNGFKCYIVTGSDRFIARTFLEGILDIPYENIIGSDTALEARNQGDTDGIEYVFTGDDVLVRTDRLLIKDLKTNKVLQIAQEIGRQPVLSFGNSSGDVSMHNYALCNNRYRSAAFQLIADDDVRDYGNPEKGPGLREKWEGMGYNVISMRDDWKTIYGEDVVKTGTFHWLENYADDKVDEVEAARKAAAEDPYTLEQVVILSRHNIRSPLSGSGSLLGDITPHQWFEWTSNPSELSLRGAMLETLMGQYFRLWLEDEGLFPENWKPEDGAVRFYANSKQRTLATARYFSAGLLPVAVVPVENHAEYDTMDPVFNPALTLLTDEYEKDVVAQIAEMGGVAGLKGIHAGLMDAIQLLMDVTDMEESKAYQAGQFGDLLADETTIKLELGKEPAMTGPIKTATSVADALTFQFYEMADEKAAAFGHDLTRDDWRKIHSIVDTYTKMLFETPLIAANAAHPLLQEIRSELTAEGRKFSFLCGHDSNVAGVLSVLGAEEYTLPDTVEPMTPIGVKLVFERWASADGEDYARVRLVYQSTEQLRGIIPLSLENPPVSFDIDLSGLERNADGYYRMDDVLERFRNAIAAYDTLVETYGGEEAQMDDAA